MSSLNQRYNNKKKVDSYLLSLLTPYIKLYPIISNSSNGYVSKCIKKVTIKQDSDVIVFNKIIAQLQFVPQDIFSGTLRNKYNFMDNTDQIFNLGSLWVLQCGWTGPKNNNNLSKILIDDTLYSDYKTYRTLLKSNLQLNKTKYSGTLQFCACSFQSFRDLVVPLDSAIQRLTNKQITLVQQDCLLNQTYINQFQKKSNEDYRTAVTDVIKIQAQRQNKINELKTNIWWDNKKAVDQQTKQINQRNQQQLKKYKRGIQDKQKQLNQLLGIKWCTLRYLISIFYNFLTKDSQFYNNYKIRISGQILYNKLIAQKSVKSDRDKKQDYSIPQKIKKLSNIAGIVKSQVLNVSGNNKTDFSNIQYFNYDNRKVEDRYFKDNQLDFNGGVYQFNDAADVLIDLYTFNKKLYESNLIQCLSKINDFIMPGFPQIRILHDNIKNIKDFSNNAGQVISIRWAIPFNQNSNQIHIYYDARNQLYQNFSIQTPTNDQMLQINQQNFQYQLNQDNQKNKALKGIINSIKKVRLPYNNKQNIHISLKHKMYQGFVKKINNGNTNPSVSKIQQGKKFAGIINITNIGDDIIKLYYFSSNDAYKQSVQVTNYVNSAKAAGQGQNFVKQMQNYIKRNSYQDISKKLISYLSNSLNINVDIHGMFNIPVFSSYIVTHHFPGPYNYTNKKRWINGKYIITGQQTVVDRTSIKTSLKRKRIPLLKQPQKDNQSKIDTYSDQKYDGVKNKTVEQVLKNTINLP